MTGRLNHMKSNVFQQAWWKGTAEAEEVKNREVVERMIDSSTIHTFAKPRYRVCLTG